jgi:hypothetical protein
MTKAPRFDTTGGACRILEFRFWILDCSGVKRGGVGAWEHGRKVVRRPLSVVRVRALDDTDGPRIFITRLRGRVARVRALNDTDGPRIFITRLRERVARVRAVYHTPLCVRISGVLGAWHRRKFNGNMRTVMWEPWHKLRRGVGMRRRGGDSGNLAGFLGAGGLSPQRHEGHEEGRQTGRLRTGKWGGEVLDFGFWIVGLPTAATTGFVPVEP